MNILIPAAGSGVRFSSAGFIVPKPMIDVLGKPMIIQAVNSLALDGRLIFVIQTQHIGFGLKDLLKQNYKDCIIIDIDYITEGPVASCLLAEKYIDNDDKLVIANCDQIMEWPRNKFSNFIKTHIYDGVVVTYYSTTPKNSYVEIDNVGKAIRLVEKKVISNESLNGIHYWRHGSYFVESAKNALSKYDKTNNEYYISTTYNYLIESGKDIRIFHIPKKEHNAIGIPSDLHEYINRKAKEWK
jgi:NDP-sugar pyrophosphorylase family protein